LDRPFLHPTRRLLHLAKESPHRGGKAARDGKYAGFKKFVIKIGARADGNRMAH
jgi:hypothetical protein